jgi:hypothetical protein
VLLLVLVIDEIPGPSEPDKIRNFIDGQFVGTAAQAVLDLIAPKV